MNVLVVGAAGYTGAALVRALLTRGHAVRGLVRQIDHGLALEKLGMELRAGDLRDPTSIHNLARESEVVFNVTASCRLEPSESRTILLDGARNLFRELDRAAPRKYIWTSNVSVYGSPRADVRLTESSPIKPTYGLGKLTLDAEKLARTSAPAVTVRVASIYGPGRDFIAGLREGRVRLLNDGSNWQSRIHVDDLVETLLAAMERAQPDSLFLAADNLPTIQSDFFYDIAAAAGAPRPLTLEANAARAVGVVGRALNALSGEPQYHLSENIIGLVTNNYFCVNEKIIHELGVQLKYPTYREGYRALLGEGTA